MALLNDYYGYDSGASVQSPLMFPENPTQANVDEYYRKLREQNATTQPPGSFDYAPYEYFGSDAFQPTDEFGNDLPADNMLDWYYNNPDAQEYIDDYWAGGNGDLNPNPDQPPPMDSGPSTPDAGQPPEAPPPERGWGYDWATGGAPGGPNWPEFSNTEDPFEMSQQDRMQAQAWADLLDQGFRDSQNTYQNLEGGFRDQAQSGPGGYGGILAGEGGFDGEQERNLLQEELLRNGIASQADLDALNLETWEMQKILGDPWAAQSIIQGLLTNMDTAQTDAQTRQREAYTDLGNRLDSAIDPNALRVSDEFDENYRFTPEDARGYAEQAARAISLRSQGERDALERSAAAAGNASPLALAAAGSWNKIQGDISAGNAYSDALLKGKGMQLDVAANRENVRQDSARDLSGRLADAASLYGQTRLGAEQKIGDDQRGLSQYGANITYDATKYGDEAQSQRTTAIADNRQKIGQSNINTRFGQAGTASTALSGRYGNIYGQKKQEEAEGRGYLTGQQDRAQAGSQAAQDRRAQMYGARTDATGKASDRFIQAKTLPTKFDKGVAFVGALMGGGKQ